MNKYQEALDRIGRNYYLSQESGDFEHFENLYLENKKILQELVDKATPKKPIDNSWSFSCPNCENLEVINNGVGYKYCRNCGQALDWSRDDNPHR